MRIRRGWTLEKAGKVLKHRPWDFADLAILRHALRIRRSLLDAHEYRQLIRVHELLVGTAGTPPFTVSLGDRRAEALTFGALREEVLGIARHGVNVNRFKGLGEMNASQLRDTTMDPARRTLVRVTVEDAAQADGVFSMLMGDAVEPRRAFIEENARLVTNLDV